ncbi:serine protease [Pseudoroseicyclus sp. CXY001]|uniref:trypsin-like serine peptidase n=1 Tax=Pseudoroseicyclus sp. CXY001 TaxID=3242492 RepID=UPI0035711C67
MIRALLLLLLCLAPPAAAQSALTALQTMDDARGWEAVGRLDMDGEGFCTSALIGERLVLTAAHCLFDAAGAPISPERLTFRAGFRGGRALAERPVRRALVHPAYEGPAAESNLRSANDLALLELAQPIRSTQITPFATAPAGAAGGEVGIVSYAMGREEAPSLQEVCGLMGAARGVLVMACDVDFGSSGAPVFRAGAAGPELVSIVSAKAELEGERIALGADLAAALPELLARMEAGEGALAAGGAGRVIVGERHDTGAKFIRP